MGTAELVKWAGVQIPSTGVNPWHIWNPRGGEMGDRRMPGLMGQPAWLSYKFSERSCDKNYHNNKVGSDWGRHLCLHTHMHTQCAYTYKRIRWKVTEEGRGHSPLISTCIHMCTLAHTNMNTYAHTHAHAPPHVHIFKINCNLTFHRLYILFLSHIITSSWTNGTA